MIVKGNAWVVGDDINTDLLAPGHAMRLGPEKMAQHTLESVNPDFARMVKAGDVLIAGKNFGCGSSREQAAICLKVLGVGAVLAESFARIFYRNAINVGLPAIAFPMASQIRENDDVELRVLLGELAVGESRKVYKLEPFHPRILEILEAGGLMNLLAQDKLKESAR